MSIFYINTDIESEERFDLRKFMEFNEGFDPLNSHMIEQIYEFKPQGYYNVQDEEANPSLLSYNIYGDVQYWWILLLYNKLESSSDLTIGSVVKYPDLADLEDLYFRLKILDRASK